MHLILRRLHSLLQMKQVSTNCHSILAFVDSRDQAFLTRRWRCICSSWTGCVLVQRCLRYRRLSSSHHDHLAGASCLRQRCWRSCCLTIIEITPVISQWSDIGGWRNGSAVERKSGEDLRRDGIMGVNVGEYGGGWDQCFR